MIKTTTQKTVTEETVYELKRIEMSIEGSEITLSAHYDKKILHDGVADVAFTKRLSLDLTPQQVQNINENQDFMISKLNRIMMKRILKAENLPVSLEAEVDKDHPITK